MSRELANSLSPDAVEDKPVTDTARPLLSPRLVFGSKPTELLTVEELAERLRVPPSWIRARTRSRTLDPLPVVRLGRYTRFSWAAVERWIADHEEGAR